MDPQAIEQFKSITNANDAVAKFYLESAGGDVEMAITNYFNSGGAHGGSDSFTDDDGDVNMTPEATPISSVPPSSGGRTLGGSSVPSSNYQPTTSSTTSSSTSKKPVTSSGGGRKFASLRDYGGDDDEKPNSKDNKYYAGGSRNSGQQIIGANDSDDDDDDENHFADKVFKAAQERGAKTRSEYDDELRQNKPKFEGSGRRLGNTEESSSLIQAEQKKKEKEVTITFWADGFTVDDGPLRLYDDPQNVQFMDSINRGFAPKELAEPGVDIAVNLLNRKTDKWAEQPKQFKAFVGSGRSLGAPSSSSSSSASSSSSSVTRTTTSSSSSSSSNLKVEVDNNKPTTSLQIRLADGGRLVGKFNLTHTIGHIRQYIRQSKPSADFDIMTQFPNKVLTEDHLTIEEAGLKGATIIQKLK